MKVATGDRGQRHEVGVTDGQEAEFVIGWTNELGTVDRWMKGIKYHPVWINPRIIDRQKKGGEVDE